MFGKGMHSAWMKATLLVLGMLCAKAYAGEPAGGAAGDKWRVPLVVRAKDPDGDKLTFRWRQIAGPKVKIADPTSPKTYFVPTEPDTYVFEIRVSDGKDEAVATIKKIVTRPNQAPVAVPKVDDKAIMGQRILVDAGESFDRDGKIKSYQWKQIAGPKLKLDDKALQDRQFHFEAKEPGTYIFELKVSDGKDWSAPARAVLKVAAVNKKPVIELEVGAEEHQLPVPKPEVHVKAPPRGTKPKPIVKKGRTIAVGEKMVLDGSQSVDPMGEKMEFFWRQLEDSSMPLLRTLRHDPKSAKGPKKTPFDCPVWFAYPKRPGTYRFVLEVTAGKGDNKREASSEPVVYVVGGKNQPPIAEIFVKTPRVERGTIVRLDGSRSRDPEGAKLKYTWTWSGEGLRPKSIVYAGPKAEFEALEEGEYGIRLIVSDGVNSSVPAKASVRVGPANQRPTVDVPTKVSAVVGQPVRIDATVNDPDKDRTEIQWTVVDPPGLKISADALRKNPLVFTPKKNRMYVFEVVAKDARGPGKSMQVQVGVSADVNRPPTAIIEGPTQALVNEKVVLSAKASHDPEKSRLTYEWQQVGGPKIPGNPPDRTATEWSFSPEAVGEYRVSLRVNDGVHASRPHEFRLQVEKGNRKPVAKIAQPPEVQAGDETWLDGSQSADADGDKLTYRWRVLETMEGVQLQGLNDPKLKVRTKGPGKLVFELVVNDGKVSSEPVTAALTIKRESKPPVALADGPERVEIGQSVVLSGKKSHDPEGERIASYRWRQVKGGSPDLGLSESALQKDRLVFRPRKAGTYVFELIVTDRDGVKSAPTTLNLVVTSRVPLAALAVKDEGPFQTGQQVILSGKRSRDPDGNRLTYHWRQTGGPTLDLPEKGTETVKLVPKEPGEYTLELVVRNGDVASKPATATFSVKPGNKPPVALITDIRPCPPGEKITLDAAKSKDPEGEELDYRWRVVDHPKDGKVKFPWRGYKRKNVQVKLPKEGKYTFELKVYDGELWSDPVKATVSTSAPNRTPVAAAVALLALPGADGGAGPLLNQAHTNKLVTEERREVVLDGSASKDPDNAPEPLTYQWKQASGPRPEKVVQDKALLRFVPTRTGRMVWELVVFDGLAKSQPARVGITVIKPGSLPVAVPERRVIHTNVATRGLRNDPNIVILDGTRSHAADGKTLRYVWKQIGGEDLELGAESLSRSRVGLKIYHAGKYRFLLTVFDGEYHSIPAHVDVIVRDPNMVKPPAGKKPKEGAAKDGAWLPPPRDVRKKVTQSGNAAPPPLPIPQPKQPTEPVQVSATKEAQPKPVKVDSKPPAVQEKPKPEPIAPQPVVSDDKTKEELPPPAKQRKTVPAPLKPAARQERPDVPAVEKKALTGIEKKLRDADYRKDDPLFVRRRQRIEALTSQPGRDAQELLIQSLNSRDKDLAALAAIGLVNRGLGSVPALIGILEKGTKQSKAQAHWALGKLSKQMYGPEPEVWRKWWSRQVEQP